MREADERNVSGDLAGHYGGHNGAGVDASAVRENRMRRIEFVSGGAQRARRRAR
ncbi:hypothetical protein [Nocardia sp. NPDC004860]|uniref:hypothetical protein n=1 Tax=Nocardia sp. NPDC004860 TaxID=3154557 RepID=UPI0033A43A97